MEGQEVWSVQRGKNFDVLVRLDGIFDVDSKGDTVWYWNRGLGMRRSIEAGEVKEGRNGLFEREISRTVSREVGIRGVV